MKRIGPAALAAVVFVLVAGQIGTVFEARRTRTSLETSQDSLRLALDGLAARPHAVPAANPDLVAPAEIAQALTTIVTAIEALSAQLAELKNQTTSQVGDAVPSGTPLTNAGSTYPDFHDLPEDVQRRLLPFFGGTAPPPGVLDAIHVSEVGWSAFLTSPSLEDEGDRALSRVAVQLFAEAKRMEEAYVDRCIRESEYVVCASQDEALSLAESYAHGLVKQPEPVLFVLLDMKPLRDSRPDYAFRLATCDRIQQLLRRPGQTSVAMLASSWTDREP